MRGELKIAPTRVGEDALRTGLVLFARAPREGSDRELKVAHARAHKRQLIIAFEAIKRSEDAEDLVGSELFTRRANIALSENEYYDDDLVGCRLVQGERELGSVLAVRHYPAQDVLELGDGKFVPLVAAFVRSIDVDAKIVRVDLPAGLLEGEPL